MIQIKTTLQLDSEQFDKYSEFLSWLKKDRENKLLVMPEIAEWLPICKENHGKFNSAALKNCKCKYDDGTVRNYNDDAPFAMITHFLYEP